jgi:hypothetical protein
MLNKKCALFYSSFNPLASYFSFIWTSDLALILTIFFHSFLLAFPPFLAFCMWTCKVWFSQKVPMDSNDAYFFGLALSIIRLLIFIMFYWVWSWCSQKVMLVWIGNKVMVFCDIEVVEIVTMCMMSFLKFWNYWSLSTPILYYSIGKFSLFPFCSWTLFLMYFY